MQAGWTFLTNHAMVLLCIARDPGTRLADIAATVAITERATQRIVNELSEAGYVSRTRVGRRNRYQVHPEARFRHPSVAHREIGELLDLLMDSPAAAQDAGSGSGPSSQRLPVNR